MNQMDEAQQFLEEMLSRGFIYKFWCFYFSNSWALMNSRFDSALRFIREMLLRNLRPNDGLLTTVVGGLCKVGKHLEAVDLWFRTLG